MTCSLHGCCFHAYCSGNIMEYFNYQLSLLAPSMRSAYIIMEPELSLSDHARAQKHKQLGPLPQKRVKQSNEKLFQGMLSHLQLYTTLDGTTSDNFAQLLTELWTTTSTDFCTSISTPNHTY